MCSSYTHARKTKRINLWSIYRFFTITIFITIITISMIITVIINMSINNSSTASSSGTVSQPPHHRGPARSSVVWTDLSPVSFLPPTNRAYCLSARLTRHEATAHIEPPHRYHRSCQPSPGYTAPAQTVNHLVTGARTDWRKVHTTSLKIVVSVSDSVVLSAMCSGKTKSGQLHEQMRAAKHIRQAILEGSTCFFSVSCLVPYRRGELLPRALV